MDELSSLERQIDPERVNSLRTHFTRRHWHPFGTELLDLVYSSPEVDFGEILQSIIGAHSIDLDPFIIAELFGTFSFFYFIFRLTFLFKIKKTNPLYKILQFRI